MRPSIILIFFIIIVFLSFGCTKTTNLKKNRELETEKIENTLHNVFEWAVNKDFNLFFNSISNDSNYRSITPYNRIKFGIEAVKRDTSFWANPKFKAVGHEIRDLRINISQDGKIAWFFCFLNDYNEWDGQPINWINVRWTGILEKQEGNWRMVQMHFSYPSQ